MLINNIILSTVPIDDLLDRFRQLVKEEVISAQNNIESEKMISAVEACKLFVPAITRPTLEKLCTEGKLQKHYVGSRVYFRKSEVFGAAKSFKRYEQYSNK